MKRKGREVSDWSPKEMDDFIDHLMRPAIMAVRIRAKQILEAASKYSEAKPGKWVVHVLGQDDVIEQPDEITALRAANGINIMIWNLPRHEHDPLIVALVKNKETDDI